MTRRRSVRSIPVIDRLGDQLQRLLRRFASRRRDVHHTVLAVARGDGSFHWMGAEGRAHPHGPPMQPGTMYFITSVTELCTAAVALLLHERTQLHLDEPIRTYLPFVIHQRHPV